MAIDSVMFHVVPTATQPTRWQVLLGRDLLMQLPSRETAIAIGMRMAERSMVNRRRCQVVLHVRSLATAA